MKTVILFGSPRKEGNTIQLVNTLSETLKNKGHSVRMLYLNDMNIRPCQGCEACLKKGVCKINDDMKDIRKYMMESDLIVFASPVYWFNMSGQLKLAVDRFFAFMDEKYNSRIKGKKAITIMTCASDDPAVFTPAIDSFKKTFDLLALTYAGGVEATGCTNKGRVKEEFKTQTRKLAESMV
jgi:multimeric flavodoxin WrbA